jgi:transposase-like protein
MPRLSTDDKAFTNDGDAIALLEAVAWPVEPVCPHCGRTGRPYDLKKTRLGLKKCRSCGLQFTVRVGTALEGSRVPPHKFLQAVLLLSSGGKPISAVRLSRILKLSYKSAWLLSRRIRAALPHYIAAAAAISFVLHSAATFA